jgi:tetratricopeptide (TPR) repeat protein
LAIDEQKLVDHIGRLVRLDLVSVDVTAREPAYDFRHVITQEVAYNLMLASQSEQLHQRLASWYELVHADDLSPLHAFLAYHWRRGGSASRAVDHLELAGVDALRNFANLEAIGFLTEAISLDRDARLKVDASRLSRWELGLGEAYVRMSKYREGREHLEAGLRLMGRRAPATARQQVLWLIGQLVAQILRRAGLRRQVRVLTQDAREALLDEIRAFEGLAEASYYGDETLLSLYCVIHILNAAEASGIPAQIARGYAGTGALFGFIPLPRVADWYVQRALDRLHGVDDLTTHELVEVVVGFYYVGAARWDLAKERFRRVLEIARPLGDRRRLDDALANLMEIEWFRGSFKSGSEFADELHASANVRQDRRFQGEALAGKAVCLLQLGNSGDAMKCLATVRSIVEDAADATIELRLKLWALLAITHLARGERQQALAASKEAMGLTASGRPTYYGSYLGYLSPAEVYLSVWEAGDATAEDQQLARDAVRRLKTYAGVFPMGRPRSATSEGRYLWLTGKRGRALRSWSGAVTSATQLSMPLEQGLAHYELGRHLDVSDPERAVQLGRAKEIFNDLGASHALAAAEAAAGRSP